MNFTLSVSKTATDILIMHECRMARTYILRKPHKLRLFYCIEVLVVFSRQELLYSPVILGNERFMMPSSAKCLTTYRGNEKTPINSALREVW